MQLIGAIARKGLYYIGLTTAQRMKKQGVELYGGSAWWILPDVIIEYIWNEYENRVKITQIWLNESLTPEETFFQTMAKRSPFKDRIVCNEPDAVYQNCKTFSDFGKITKRLITNHPYVLTIDDFDILRKSEFWFARKFDVTVDEKILDVIDNKLLKSTNEKVDC